MRHPILSSIVSAIICCGGGFALYCVSPAGAAEREQTRQQKEMARKFANQQIKSAQKRNID